jgi:hypothetical protein
VTEMTAPTEFLHELGDINGFIADLVACPLKAGWHWPTFYLLYVEVDRLSMLLMRLRSLFAAPVMETASASPEEFAEDLHGFLAEIGRRQKVIVGSLWQMYRETKPTLAQQALHDRVTAHAHPKSGWYQTLMSHCGAGEVSNDHRVLMRTALPIDTRSSKEHIDSGTAACMLRYQSFDIGTSQARLLLASAVEELETRIGAVLALMGKHLLAHCRIENLLHPCSR